MIMQATPGAIGYSCSPLKANFSICMSLCYMCASLRADQAAGQLFEQSTALLQVLHENTRMSATPWLNIRLDAGAVQQYLGLGPVFLCGDLVELICAVLALPDTVVSHGGAGGDQVDAAAHSSQGLFIFIVAPVISSANHSLDPA